jgi:flagellar hook-basal body complex protein FliE
MLETLVPAVAGVGASAPVQPSAAANQSTQTAASGEDFASMLASMTTDAIDTVKAAESTSISGIKDKASVQQVVESVMAAEQSLQTAIAVRDKVVAAYMEISRMAI